MRPWATAPLFFLIVHPCSAQWAPQEGGTKARLRGLCVVNRDVAWASGTGGTCLRTVDAGKTWGLMTVPGTKELDFRDIHAIDADTAVLLSIGAGEQSRIYRTTDGGRTWAVAHTNRDPQGFLDAIAFWDAEHGLALGDPVDGRFVILTTNDGGNSWTLVPGDAMPGALAGEGAFAASGTCLVVQGETNAWFGTGGGKVARVFRSTDQGRTWTAHETPVRAGTSSSGIFSLAFWDAERGVAIGGDYKQPEQSGGYVARTADGGQTWRLAVGTRPSGYRSGVAVVPGSRGPSLVAVGPTGTDVSVDGGENWHSLGSVGFDAVGFTGPEGGWAVGEEGRIARFTGGLSAKP